MMGTILQTVLVAAAIAIVVAAIIAVRRGMAVRAAIPGLGSMSWKWLPALGLALLLAVTLLLPTSTLIFWGVVVAIGGWLTVSYMPASWDPWRKLPQLVGILMVVIGVYQSGLGVWTSRGYDNVVERCLGLGDCSEPHDYIRTVANGTVTISRGGSDRFLGTRTFKIKNGSQSQCINLQVDTEHTSERQGNSFVVRETGSNELIHIASWEKNTWEITVEVAPGRVETYTVITIPLGKEGCRTVSL